MPGMTAYTGLLEIGRPQGGRDRGGGGGVGRGGLGGRPDRARSRAAGRSASPAARTSATTSTNELGFDACIDQRDPDLPAQLQGACPKGIDVYFENVGGAVFEAVFPLLNAFARMPVCGLIAQYNDTRRGRRNGPRR